MSSSRRLVVIMLDGFRWDYADKFFGDALPEALASFRSDGVAAEYVQPVFPANSFACWTSIVTGLYPEDHGILDNYFYDAERKRAFSLDDVGALGEDKDDGTKDPVWWSQHVPIWTKATHQGIRTAVYGWSRCDVPVTVDGEDIVPEKAVPFASGATETPEQMAQVLRKTLEDLRQGFNLVMVYSNGVDHEGHDHGPDSSHVKDMISSLDAKIAAFLKELYADNDLSKNTDVVLLSDHGMTTNAGMKLVSVTDLPQETRDKIELAIGYTGHTQISLKSGVDVSTFVSECNSCWNGQEALVDVFRRASIPHWMRFGANPRVCDVLVVSKGKCLVFDTEEHLKGYDWTKGGSHGFNDMSCEVDGYTEGQCPDMRTIFMARGPSFKAGYKQAWMKLVDVFQCLANSVGLSHATGHEGDWTRVKGMFRQEISIAHSPAERSSYIN